MAELTYEDFKNRVNIQDLLVDAGYRQNRRDGLRYPSYVRIGSDGKRVHGDKFIVTANGLCCFQPPERKNYNVISFIKEHPELFVEYTPGMSKDRLVNLVCNRLLNQPVPECPEQRFTERENTKPFRMDDYQIHAFDPEQWETQKPFYPFFKSRGISLQTQRAFAGHFVLATKERTDRKRYTNLAFPLTLATQGNREIVGLEERSRPNVEGKTAYKGMAAGSNAAEGLWIARLEGHCSDRGTAAPLNTARDVYWFESAFDAMAYYQLNRERLIDHDAVNGLPDTSEREKDLEALGNAVFVSTGGNPSNKQFASMIGQTPHACHHLCFDRDKAGQMYCVNFAMQKAGRTFTSYLSMNKSHLIVTDLTDSFKRQELGIEPFDFHEICAALGIAGEKHPMYDYMQSLEQKDNPYSGDYDLLPKELYRLCGKYESLAGELHSAQNSRLVCPEDLEGMKEDAVKAGKAFADKLKEAIADYGMRGPGIVYEPCDEHYKDWNDQLMQKPMKQEEQRQNPLKR